MDSVATLSDPASNTASWTWISWFCAQKGNELLVEVDHAYIEDRFNLCGLPEQVPHFRRAFAILTDTNTSAYGPGGNEGDEDNLDSVSSAVAEQAAELLYSLVHQRFILSPRGITLMAERFRKSKFGTCPRVLCNNQAVIPVGTSDMPGEGRMRLYCPKCQDLYVPRTLQQRNLDGSFFGTGFPAMLLLSVPSLIPKYYDYEEENRMKKWDITLYGFKIHPSAFEVGKTRRIFGPPEKTSSAKKKGKEGGGNEGKIINKGGKGKGGGGNDDQTKDKEKKDTSATSSTRQSNVNPFLGSRAITQEVMQRK